MPGLLLAGVALCAALIMVAALAGIRGWRRGSGPPPAPGSARGAAAGRAGDAMARDEISIVPGFGDPAPPAPGAQVPGGRATGAQAPGAQVPGGRAPGGRATGAQVPGVQAPGVQAPGGRVPVPPGRAVLPRAGPAVRPPPDAHGPGPVPNGRRAAAGPVPVSDQIARYYDQADQPMADYLTVLGWAQPPRRPHPPDPAGHTGRQPPPDGGPRQ